MHVRVLIPMLLVALPSVAASQGLGDAAQRERDRRAEKQHEGAAPPAVLTNEDLKREQPAAEAQEESKDGKKKAARKPQAAPAPATATAEPEGPTPFEERRQREQEFERAIDAARARVQEQQTRLAELEAKLNPMSTTFIYGPTGSNSATDEMRARQELQQGQAALAEANAAVVTAQEALDLFRRGRTDVRPGGGTEPAQPQE